MSFTSRVHQDAGSRAVRLEFTGELDIASAPSASQALDAAANGGFGLVIVDLRRLTFLDASALGLLVRCDAAVRASGRRLAVVRGSGVVARLLELTRAHTSLHVVDDLCDIDDEDVDAQDVA